MIIRKAHKSHYTVIDNTCLRDASLSFRATGLLCYFLSLPDDWRISGRQLAKVKKEKKDAVLSALKELETAGYIKRGKINDEKGRLVNMCTVSEMPHKTISNCSDSPETGKPDAVEPDAVKPATLEVLSYEVPNNKVTRSEKRVTRKTDKPDASRNNRKPKEQKLILKAIPKSKDYEKRKRELMLQAKTLGVTDAS